MLDSDLKIALVHDYLNQAGGAEKVVEIFHEMFPDAPLYTSVYDRDAMPDIWRSVDIRTTFLQRLSPRATFVRFLTPLYPTAFEQFDLREYDLVLSSTTTFAKGVITRPDTCHVCYCNNPTRFLWMYHDYLERERLPAPARALLPLAATLMRPWDYAAAQRVDYFIAGSHNAARRIAKFYRREADVLQAPIDARSFALADEVGDYFLSVSRLQSYKRIDLAIEACNRLGVELHVIGDGPDRTRLEGLAGPTVKLLGRLPDDAMRRELSRCRAFILPGEEDFGLASLEAQASGRPVIAYQAGGALETMVEGETGVFFSEPTVESLREALAGFEDTFDPQTIRRHAMRFDKSSFKERLSELLARKYAEHRENLAG
ncbi:MAG: glycosyltransferase [Chloroflexota bacterium]